MLHKTQDQVLYKRQLQNGNVLVRNGQILSVTEDGSQARVYFPIDYSTETIPMDQLESTKDQFGAGVRHPAHPGYRTLVKI